MFLLRSVRENDLDDLYELSQMAVFLNLPADIDLLEKKIKTSLKTFASPNVDKSKNYYFFVLEDLKAKKVIGASMIHAQHGNEEAPHFYLKVDRENRFSQTINTGFVHGTLKLGHDTDGPSEIGGLILSPDYRGNPNKLGKQLSYVRFLFMGLNPNLFKETIHCELMPPLDKEGNSPLWEAIGRKFMNMDYQAADRLSLVNKEFILSLFPKETIYVPLLPLEARNAIGVVGEQTKPVKKMLESIGFHYINEIDPFDGGPHYQAKLKDITLVKNLKSGTVQNFDENYIKKNNNIKQLALFHMPEHIDHFTAAVGNLWYNDGKIWLDSETQNIYQIKPGHKLDFISL